MEYSVTLLKNRPLSKLASTQEVEGDSEHRTAAYIEVREDSSLAGRAQSTYKFPAEVEFRKGSIAKKLANLTMLAGKYLFLASIILLASTGCGGKSSQTMDLDKIKTIKVSLRPLEKTMYFSGNIQPLDIVNVTGPEDGVVQAKYFSFGQRIQKDMLLMEIISSKFESDYYNALAQYLKAKDDYYSGKSKFIGTEDLFKHELMSRNEYESEKRTLANSYLSFLQARFALQKLIKANGVLDLDKKLSLVDTAAVEKALKKSVSNIKIYSPVSGIAILPSKSGSGDSSSGESTSTLEVGNQIKLGQILLSIGNLTGIAMNMQIAEVDIDKVKVGQNVTVTFSAYPDLLLRGQINEVGSQAKSAAGNASGIATFPVKVVVPSLTEEQRKKLQIGMTAKVTLVLQYPPAIMLPINAIHQGKNSNMVKIIDRKTKQIKEVPVKTGNTTQDEVQIMHGLSVGDEVVLS